MIYIFAIKDMGRWKANIDEKFKTNYIPFLDPLLPVP